MADIMETEDGRSVIKEKLRQQFDGKIVRKDLTKKSKKAQMSQSMFWNSFWDSIAALMTQKSLRTG